IEVARRQHLVQKRRALADLERELEAAGLAAAGYLNGIERFDDFGRRRRGQARPDHQRQVDAAVDHQIFPVPSGTPSGSVTRNWRPMISASASGRSARLASASRHQASGSLKYCAARLSSRSPCATVCCLSNAKRSGAGTERRVRKLTTVPSGNVSVVVATP